MTSSSHPTTRPALLLSLLALLGATVTIAAQAAAPARFRDLALAQQQQGDEQQQQGDEQQHQQLLRLRAGAGRPTNKTPPVWPEQFHAVLLQNRDGALADVDLYYDHPGGRNLNIIKSRDDGSVLWDNERNNGSTYYYYPENDPPTCSVIPFPVGILRPDWLAGAKYKGVKEYNGHQCDVWAQGSSYRSPKPFVTYYCDVKTQEPVHWVFFDGGFFDVIEWIPGGTLGDDQWQLPAYCFDDDDEQEEQGEAVATATD